MHISDSNKQHTQIMKRSACRRGNTACRRRSPLLSIARNRRREEDLNEVVRYKPERNDNHTSRPRPSAMYQMIWLNIKTFSIYHYIEPGPTSTPSSLLSSNASYDSFPKNVFLLRDNTEETLSVKMFLNPAADVKTAVTPSFTS